MGQTQAHRDGRRSLQRETKSRDTAAVHIDGDGQIGASDRATVLGVDHNEIRPGCDPFAPRPAAQGEAGRSPSLGQSADGLAVRLRAAASCLQGATSASDGGSHCPRAGGDALGHIGGALRRPHVQGGVNRKKKIFFFFFFCSSGRSTRSWPRPWARDRGHTSKAAKGPNNLHAPLRFGPSLCRNLHEIGGLRREDVRCQMPSPQ